MEKENFEIKYVEFKNANWNYLKIKINNKTIIYINKKEKRKKMNLEIFNYEDKDIRTVNKDSQVWFVAKDVCDILEIKDTRTIIERLDEDEWDKTTVIDNLGRRQDTYILTESGVYEAIIRSNKKEANNFKRWIRKEVVPTIRKTGGYVANEKLFIDTYLPFADEITKKLFSSTLEVVKSQNRIIGEMKTKVDYFDRLVDRNLLTNFRDTAKELKVQPKQFNEYLLNLGYVYKDKKGRIKPYQPYVKNGLFELKEYYNNNHADTQTLITPKGRETFKLLFQ